MLWLYTCYSQPTILILNTASNLVQLPIWVTILDMSVEISAVGTGGHQPVISGGWDSRVLVDPLMVELDFQDLASWIVADGM